VKTAVKKTAASKAAPKKAVAKKATTKKAAPKKAAAKKTKKAAAKPKPKPKPKARRVTRERTPEEKQKLYVKELRKQALREPCRDRKLTAYNAFMKEQGLAPGNPEQKSVVAKFKNLTPAEIEVSGVIYCAGAP
jgi:hypothetical protein